MQTRPIAKRKPWSVGSDDLSQSRRQLLRVLGAVGLLVPAGIRGQPQAVIASIKRSVVAVGTLQRTRVPPFVLRATGFVIGDGTVVATNAHVLPETVDGGADAEALAVALPAGAKGEVQVRVAQILSRDRDRDLALIRLAGAPLPALKLGDSDAVREGDQLLVTGFPLGTILGAFPVTHRAMISAIAPIVMPQAAARQLDGARIRGLLSGAFPIFQLDAAIFPGNSGSPLYSPDSGAVLGVVNMAFVRALREGKGAPPTGIAYAIPASHVAALLTAVK